MKPKTNNSRREEKPFGNTALGEGIGCFFVLLGIAVVIAVLSVPYTFWEKLIK